MGSQGSRAETRVGGAADLAGGGATLLYVGCMAFECNHHRSPHLLCLPAPVTVVCPTPLS